MRMRSMLGMALLVGVLPCTAQAQGSVFGLRGLGWLGRPVSGRTASTGGALAMFDPEMVSNPAALSRWRSVAGWAVGAPTRRTFDGPSGSVVLQTVRFPLFGFAAVLPTRTMFGFALTDFLDRTWTITRRDSSLLRGLQEKFTDAGRSIGGVSDMSLGVAYRVTPELSLGLGFHHYLGSARLTSQRLYDSLSYDQVIEQSITEYSGTGVSVGMLASIRGFDLSVSARVNGSLRSSNTSGLTVYTHLPVMLGVGLRVAPVPGVFIAGSFEYAGWHAANADLIATAHDGSRNTMSIGVGAEALSVTLLGLHTPLRIGYRWRQLPFLSLGRGIDESGVSGGFGINFARDRTTLDIGVEHGSRSTSAEKEAFNSVFVGLTVRP